MGGTAAVGNRPGRDEQSQQNSEHVFLSLCSSFSSPSPASANRAQKEKNQTDDPITRNLLKDSSDSDGMQNIVFGSINGDDFVLTYIRFFEQKALAQLGFGTPLTTLTASNPFLLLPFIYSMLAAPTLNLYAMHEMGKQQAYGAGVGPFNGLLKDYIKQEIEKGRSDAQIMDALCEAQNKHLALLYSTTPALKKKYTAPFQFKFSLTPEGQCQFYLLSQKKTKQAVDLLAEQAAEPERAALEAEPKRAAPKGWFEKICGVLDRAGKWCDKIGFTKFYHFVLHLISSLVPAYLFFWLAHACAAALTGDSLDLLIPGVFGVSLTFIIIIPCLIAASIFFTKCFHYFENRYHFGNKLYFLSNWPDEESIKAHPSSYIVLSKDRGQGGGNKEHALFYIDKTGTICPVPIPTNGQASFKEKLYKLKPEGPGFGKPLDLDARQIEALIKDSGGEPQPGAPTWVSRWMHYKLFKDESWFLPSFLNGIVRFLLSALMVPLIIVPIIPFVYYACGRERPPKQIDAKDQVDVMSALRGSMLLAQYDAASKKMLESANVAGARASLSRRNEAEAETETKEEEKKAVSDGGERGVSLESSVSALVEKEFNAIQEIANQEADKAVIALKQKPFDPSSRKQKPFDPSSRKPDAAYLNMRARNPSFWGVVAAFWLNFTMQATRQEFFLWALMGFIAYATGIALGGFAVTWMEGSLLLGGILFGLAFLSAIRQTWKWYRKRRETVSELTEKDEHEAHIKLTAENNYLHERLLEERAKLDSMDLEAIKDAHRKALIEAGQAPETAEKTLAQDPLYNPRTADATDAANLLVLQDPHAVKISPATRFLTSKYITTLTLALLIVADSFFYGRMVWFPGTGVITNSFQYVLNIVFHALGLAPISTFGAVGLILLILFHSALHAYSRHRLKRTEGKHASLAEQYESVPLQHACLTKQVKVALERRIMLERKGALLKGSTILEPRPRALPELPRTASSDALVCAALGPARLSSSSPTADNPKTAVTNIYPEAESSNSINKKNAHHKNVSIIAWLGIMGAFVLIAACLFPLLQAPIALPFGPIAWVCGLLIAMSFIALFRHYSTDWNILSKQEKRKVALFVGSLLTLVSVFCLIKFVFSSVLSMSVLPVVPVYLFISASIVIAALFFANRLRAEHPDYDDAKYFLERSGLQDEILQIGDEVNKGTKFLSRSQKERLENALNLVIMAINPNDQGRVDITQWKMGDYKKSLSEDLGQLQRIRNRVCQDGCISFLDITITNRIFDRFKQQALHAPNRAQLPRLASSVTEEQDIVNSKCVIFILTLAGVLFVTLAALSVAHWIQYILVITMPFLMILKVFADNADFAKKYFKNYWEHKPQARWFIGLMLGIVLIATLSAFFLPFVFHASLLVRMLCPSIALVVLFICLKVILDICDVKIEGIKKFQNAISKYLSPRFLVKILLVGLLFASVAGVGVSIAVLAHAAYMPLLFGSAYALPIALIVVSFIALQVIYRCAKVVFNFDNTAEARGSKALIWKAEDEFLPTKAADMRAGEIYFKKAADGGLNYIRRRSDDVIITGSLQKDDLESLGLVADLSTEILKQHKDKILNLLALRGHAPGNGWLSSIFFFFARPFVVEAFLFLDIAALVLVQIALAAVPALLLFNVIALSPIFSFMALIAILPVGFFITKVLLPKFCLAFADTSGSPEDALKRKEQIQKGSKWMGYIFSGAGLVIAAVAFGLSPVVFGAAFNFLLISGVWVVGLVCGEVFNRFENKGGVGGGVVAVQETGVARVNEFVQPGERSADVSPRPFGANQSPKGSTVQNNNRFVGGSVSRKSSVVADKTADKAVDRSPLVLAG